MGYKSGYGGSIRQSGGKMGERGAVLEDSYFLRKASKILIMIIHNTCRVECIYCKIYIQLLLLFVCLRIKCN